MAQNIETLTKRIREINHLKQATAVLEWDLQTNMPPGGATARSEQMGYISRLAHEMFTAPDTGLLIKRAEEEGAELDKDSDEARLLELVRRDYNQYVKIPADLTETMARHSALSQEIWAKARAQNDFATFAPLLEKTLDLTRQMTEKLGYEKEPYDALLDLYERDAKTEDIAAMFADLKPHLIELTQAIVASDRYKEDVRLTGTYPTEKQNAITKRLAEAVGYDFTRGRQDQAAHPFCTHFSCDDVRITTRFDEAYLPMALYATLHEAGHAMYEQGSPEKYDNTPLGGGVSMGIHESQSRMWENLVGRSRAFCTYALPQLKETFPDLADVDVEQFYRAVNRVTPSFIRVEADEVTYNLHVLLRFELERELLSGRLPVADLPDAWNAKMREYLGIAPPDHTQGVLQDVHWAAGMVGYFPTYTLGNLVSGHLWFAIRKALPDLDTQIERGEFAPLLGWLRKNIHQFGKKYRPAELIERATGEPLTSRHYVDYLKAKYSALYALAK